MAVWKRAIRKVAGRARKHDEKQVRIYLTAVFTIRFCRHHFSFV
jgi:hypothetical protein